MLRTLAVALSFTLALPAVSIPTAADAQVLTGRGAARPAPRRPAITEAELDRLYAAEDLIAELDGQIAEIRAAAEAAGGLSEAQTREIEMLTRRRNDAQRTVDRLERKRNG